MSDGTGITYTFAQYTSMVEVDGEVRKNLYQCGNGEYIQWLRVCDGNVDCHDGTDESNCSQFAFYTRRGALHHEKVAHMVGSCI